MGLCIFLASLFSKKVKNTVFFAIFEHKPFKKAENTMFFAIFDKILGEKLQKHGVFCSFLLKMCRQKFIGA